MIHTEDKADLGLYTGMSGKATFLAPSTPPGLARLSLSDPSGLYTTQGTVENGTVCRTVQESAQNGAVSSTGYLCRMAMYPVEVSCTQRYCKRHRVAAQYSWQYRVPIQFYYIIPFSFRPVQSSSMWQNFLSQNCSIICPVFWCIHVYVWQFLYRLVPLCHQNSRCRCWHTSYSHFIQRLVARYIQWRPHKTQILQ